MAIKRDTRKKDPKSQEAPENLSEESNQMAVEIMEVVAKLALATVGECNCTIHRRTGDIDEICDICAANVSLTEIHECAMGYKND